MPLINFTTNLTSLKYGQPNTGDRPGGGYSGQPYIEFPIETPGIPQEFQRYYRGNRDNLDFPIRGGSITQLVTGGGTTPSAAIDAKRIEKFFNDAPRGTTFIQKQIGLQRSNPRTQVPLAVQLAGMNLSDQTILTTQTYDPLNTLAQVSVQGTGAHFNRHGVVPTITENYKNTYEYYVGAYINNLEFTNRLAILRSTKLGPNTGFYYDNTFAVSLGIDPGAVNRLGIAPSRDQILKYEGGPGSVYGIGTTIIARATDTQPIADPVTRVSYSMLAFTYNQLMTQETDRGYDNAYPTPQDFRAQVNTNVTSNNVPQPVFEYTVQSLENRLHIGNPGGRLYNPNYTVAKPNGQDTVNMLSPFYYTATQGSPWVVEPASIDIIKFGFECMSNDEPGSAVALLFRAFLEGQITDSNTAEYNSFKYLGRGETFKVYQGFNRSISFTFKIAAQSRQEMRPLYTKLNHLISQVYPDYAPQTGIMRGNVVKLTIGDYIYRMPGFLENVNVTIDNGTTPWEIVLGGTAEEDMAQLPHVITVACTFTPIMNILPRREKSTANLDVNNSYVPLIANTDKAFLDSNIVGATAAPNGQATTATNSGVYTPATGDPGLVLDKTGFQIPGIDQLTSNFIATQAVQ